MDSESWQFGMVDVFLNAPLQLFLQENIQTMKTEIGPITLGQKVYEFDEPKKLKAQENNILGLKKFQ